MDPDLLYEEDVLVKDEYSGKSGLPERLKVINRYMYTENDTIVLKNYSCKRRLSAGERKTQIREEA